MDHKLLSLWGPVLALFLFLLSSASSQSANKIQFLTIEDHESKVPCLLLTASGATSKLYKAGAKEPELKQYTDPKLPDPNPVKCQTSPDMNKADELILIFGELTVTWKFNFTGPAWDILPVSAKIGAATTLDLSKSPTVYNTVGFSYSCQKATFDIAKTTEYDAGTITIEGFQVQPYYKPPKDAKNAPARFDDSSDCTVWFTLPIFSGLIVVLLLITILHFGVIALMSISTPDRFENPKGKTLIITNFDE